MQLLHAFFRWFDAMHLEQFTPDGYIGSAAVGDVDTDAIEVEFTQKGLFQGHFACPAAGQEGAVNIE